MENFVTANVATLRGDTARMPLQDVRLLPRVPKTLEMQKDYEEQMDSFDDMLDVESLDALCRKRKKDGQKNVPCRKQNKKEIDESIKPRKFPTKKFDNCTNFKTYCTLPHISNLTFYNRYLELEKQKHSA
jgi:hypothetical protein